MKRWIYSILCACCLFVPSLARATVTTQAGSGQVCPGSEIDIQISVSDTLRNVSAISLALQYDNTKLTYLGYQDACSGIANSVMVNASGGKVYISWYSTTPISIDDNLLSIRFEGLASGNCSLAWDTPNCEYANEEGNPITSNYSNGSVTVYAPPAITSHPSNVSITAGNNAVFQVSASGQSITYQWQVKTAGGGSWTNLANGSAYSNVTTYRMTANNVTQSMNGNQYRCVVSGTCSPSAYSNAATLLVGQTTIVTAAGSTSSCPSTTFVIPVTVTNCNNVGALSLSLGYNSTNYLTYVGYQNLHPDLQSGQYQVNASNGSVFFTWANSGSSLDIGSGTLVELLFESTPGNSVFLWNTSQCEYSDPMGNVLSSSYSSGSVTVYYAPHINSNPVNRSIYEGNSTTFSVSAGGQGISYTWQVSTDYGATWTNCVNGTYYNNVSTNTLTVRNVTVDMSGYQYRCVVCGTCEPCAYSLAATLTVNYIINTAVSGISTCPNEVFSCPVTVSNFNNVGAISLALNYNPSVLTFVGVADVNEALGSGLMANASNGTAYISWYSTQGVSIGNGTLLQLQFTGQTGSCSLTWDANNSEYAMPDGTPITMTFSNSNVYVYAMPTITSQPESRCLYAGQNTTFSINASGQGISYQWQVSANNGGSWYDLLNSEHYANVTNRTLSVNNVTTGMNNYYFRCKVTGTCGSPIYSESAKLEVAIAQPVVRAEDATWPCTGEVSQDILVEHFDNIGAFSLVLDYDTNYLRYLEYYDVNSALQSNYFIINPTMGRIYVTYASGNALNIGSGTLFSLKFSSSGGNSTNHWQTGLCEVADIDGNVFDANYVNGYIKVFSNCGFTDIDDEYWAYEEIMYLCNRGIVSGYQCEVKPERNIKRSELAKIAYLGLFGRDVSLVSDHFPSPFLDLQKTDTYYYRYAKALSYLEYGDGVAPFDRNKMNFNPNGEIKRIYVIKALMEAYNIPPTENGLQIFNDVPPTMKHYGYVNSAAILGIIDDTYDEFYPDRLCTRAEAFVWLYHILTSQDLPSVNNSNYLQETDFFVPGNYTPYNFSSILGDEVGNYNYSSKACFDIPGRGGMGIGFSYFYSSFMTELPNQLLPTNPLGAGWSHSYNAYMINTEEILDDYGNELAVPCLILVSSDGSIMVFDNENEPEYPAPVTKGIYSTLRKVTGNKYILKDKSQVEYTFERTNDSIPYMLTLIKDRNDNATTLSYEIGEEGMPRLVSVTDPANRSLSFSYKAGTNYLSSVTDPMNRSVTFKVENDNLVKYYDIVGDSVSYYYQNNERRYEHLLDSIVMPKGNIIKNEYEQRKLVSTQRNNDIPTTITHQPNYSNRSVAYSTTMTEAIDENRTVSVSHQFDGYGNPIHVSMNGVADITRSYSNPNDPTMLTEIHDDIQGITVSYEHDANGNITKTTMVADGFEIVQEAEYNEFNDPISYTDANGNTTHYYYTDGNLTRIVDALGNETQYTYNEFGQVETATDPIGVTTTFDYDDYGNCNTESIPGLEMTVHHEYDLSGRLISLTDALGRTSTFEYDLNDNLITETDPMGHVTTYEYDKNDNLTAIINAKGEATTYVYDFDNDWLMTETFQGISKHYAYNVDGSIKTYTNPNGDTFSYSYDEKGRVTSNGIATYSYYPNGQLKSVARNGKSIVYAYDALNRVSSVAYDGKTIGYAYDNNSNMVKIVYPGGLEVDYGYDALNRLVSVEDWNHNVTQYHYRPNSQLDYVEYPNQMVTTYVYDDFGREEGVNTVRSDGTVIASYTFDLDKNGNHLSETILEPYRQAPVLPLVQKSYTYDLGNRLLSDGVLDFEYDYNGNMTRKGSDNYSFDLQDNLSSYMGNNSLSYGYDGLGIRRSMSRNGITYNYVMDVMNSANVLMELQGAEVQNYYIYGNGLISRIKPNNETEYYVSDFRGSVVAMVDDSEDAVITHRYQYDSWGNLLQNEETDFNPFRYVGNSGVMYDDSTLYYMRARFYDPSIGRFISEDPIWSSNLYPYADNNPVMKVDINGKVSEVVVDLVGVGIDAYSTTNYFIETCTEGPSASKTAEIVASKAAHAMNPAFGYGVDAVIWAGEKVVDYYDRKAAYYQGIIEEQDRKLAEINRQRQNQGYSGASSNEWKPVISYTDHVEHIVEVRSPRDPNSHILDYLDYYLYGTPFPDRANSSKVHQTISKNLLQKRAYAKKKAYMQEKVKRYEHLRKMLIERMTR